MTSRRLLLAILLVLAASVAWLVLGPRTSNETPDGPGPQAAATAPPEGAPAALDVLVVDRAGHGVGGVAVALVAVVEGMDGETTHAEGTSDDAGHVALPLREDVLAQAARLGLTVGYRVLARVEAPEPPAVALGADPRRREPVRLVLPAAGSVRVLVRDERGARVAFDGRVYLFWRAAGSADAWTRRGLPWAPVSDGGARFAVVPLGQELLFRSDGVGRWFSGEVVVAGPTAGGQQIEAELRLGPAKPTATGILVDETDTPLASTEVGVGFAPVDEALPPQTPAARPGQMRRVTTDAAGRFEEHVPFRGPAEGMRILLVIERDGSESGREAAVQRAVVPLPADLGPGQDVDLGRIALVSTAVVHLLVKGRVVDEENRPLAGASVSAGHLDLQRGQWQALHRHRVTSDAQGRFEVHTTVAAPATWTLSAAMHGRVGQSIEVERGTEEVVLRLEVGGRLDASFRAPEGIPWMRLQGVVVRPDGEHAAPNQALGRFGYDNLRAGRYGVLVRIRSTSWTLVRIEDVDVPRGGAAKDPRIRDIDLAGTCRLLRLRVLDPTGAPLSRRAAWIRDEHGEGGQVRTNEDGRVVIVVPTAARELTLVSGPARAAVAPGQGEQEVRLLGH